MNTRSLKYISLIFSCISMVMVSAVFASEDSEVGAVSEGQGSYHQIEVVKNDKIKDPEQKSETDSQKGDEAKVEGEELAPEVESDTEKTVLTAADETSSQPGIQAPSFQDPEMAGEELIGLEGKVVELTSTVVENDTEKIVSHANKIIEDTDRFLTFFEKRVRMKECIVNGKKEVFFDTNIQTTSSKPSVYGAAADSALREVLLLK